MDPLDIDIDEDAAEAARNIPDGQTVFHETLPEDDFEEFSYACSRWLLDKMKKGEHAVVSKARFLEEVNKRFQLEASEHQLSYFLNNYVIKTLAVTPRWIREQIVEEYRNLDTVGQKLDAVERIDEKLESEDLTPNEVRALLSERRKTLESAEDTLRDFGVYPEDDSGGGGPGVIVNVDRERVKKKLNAE